MLDLRWRHVLVGSVAVGAYFQPVAVHILEHVVPYAVLGMAGGLVSAFGMPKPTKAFMALSMFRSAVVGFAVAQLLIGFDVNRALVFFGTVAAALVAEELLTGFARIAGAWADRPFETLTRLSSLVSSMRSARGLPEPKPKETDHESDRCER